ncbi:TPA: TrbM/KikA/MpfK family conjugal transfer protein [Neisseria meningitidis]
MQKSLIVAALSLCMASPAFADIFANPDNPAAQPQNQLLTGDTRLACEAILCLSSGTRPSECAPSIKRYFSISHKRLRDTLKARRNFLNLCPSGHENGMPQLINAIANGGGRCDAASLNKRGYWTGSRRDGDRHFVVDTSKPDYCQAYENHEWTRIATTKLEPVYCTRTVENGSRRWSKQRTEKYQCGSKWVDVPAKD